MYTNVFSVETKIHSTLFRKKFKSENIYCKKGISKILDNSLKKMACVINKIPLCFEDMTCSLSN